MTLWHRTCRDAAKVIERTGVLRPNMHPLIGYALVWMADRPTRSRASLGLTSWTLSCDRMERLFEVREPVDAVRWLDCAKAHDVPPGILGSGDPRCWWVSEVPQTVYAIEEAA